jgi:outer membrane protein assembly factor BamB
LELFSFFSRGVDGAVDFGSGDGDVYALDAVSGCLKWKLKTGDDAEIHNQAGIHP